MQSVLHYSPVKAGATFLPMTILIIVVAPIAGRLSDRIGSRWLMAGGMVLVSASGIVFAQLSTSSNFWTLLPGMLLGGVGMASVMSPMTAAALGAVPVDKAGVGSGVLNTFRQVGGSLGIAMMGAIMAAKAGTMDTAALDPEKFVSGLSLAMYVMSVIALTAAVVAATTIRQVRHLDRAALAEAAA
jgi:MFS family permease